MDPCEMVDEWQNMTAQERLDALEEMINDGLEGLGYAPVTTEIADLSNSNANADYSNGHVRFDAEHLEGEDALKLIETAYHEMAHAMEHQDGDYGSLTDEEREQYNDEWIVDDSEDGAWEFEENDFHPDIEAFADYMTGQAVKDCQSQEPSGGEVYGSGSSDLPFEFEIGEPVIEDEQPDGGTSGATGGDFDFEIDYENAVFSSGGSNE